LEFDADAFEDLAWWIENDRKKALKIITANTDQTRHKRTYRKGSKQMPQ
jgi:hypothetical protein